MLAFLVVVALGLGVGSATDAGAQPGTTGAAATPQLRIAIDDGHTTVAPGDQLAYTLTIENLGTTDVSALQVTQTVPTGLTFVSADASGASRPGTVAWNVDLKASATATLHSAMAVSATPPDLLRLASVACASASATGPPVVCATHSDQLPAGAAAAASAASTADAASTAAVANEASHTSWWLLGLLLAIVCALVAAVVIFGRRSPPGARSTPGARGGGRPPGAGA